MYSLQERLIRGRTHVETVYLTLLEHVLRNQLSPTDFYSYFISYIYRSVVVPEILRDKTGELDKHFRSLVDKAFKRKLGDKFEITPDFVNTQRDPYDICIEFLLRPEVQQKLFTEEERRKGEHRGKAKNICNEILFEASMSFLRSLDLIR